MISRKLAVFALLVLIPTLASAQRRGGSRSTGNDKPDWNELGGKSGGLQLSNRDVENISPIKLLIDKRKDLKLTDDQLKQIKDLDGKLKEQNQPLFKALDSLRTAMRSSSTAGDEDRSSIMSARREVGGVVHDIRATYETSLKDAMALLDDAQRATAEPLLQKHAEESDRVLSEKLGGRRGGESGRSGRPPRV